MPLNLFIIGPSGCGKSTQAKLIAEKYNLKHLSTGEILREEIASGSGFGLEAKSYVDAGTWAPDDLVFDILVNRLSQIDYQNFIIDGFPRVLNQGRIIELFLKKKNLPFSLLIHLNLTFDEIAARREKMGTEFQDSSRSDNTPQAVATRQKTYNETIDPIKEYFRSKNLLFDVDGNRPVEPIFADIVKKIDQIIN